jgi:hypothetical protein
MLLRRVLEAAPGVPADAARYAPVMRPILAAAVALAIAGPALAHSTVILPEPGGTYLIIPPAGPSTPILPQHGGGALVVTPGRPSTVILPLPDGSGETVPFSAAGPCCPGLPAYPQQ